MTREGRRTNLKPHIYNTAESGWKFRTAQWSWHPTLRGWYFGTLAKGWYRLGPWKGMEVFEVEFAIGGEDNMVQFGIAFPFLGRWTIGVRVPRKLTNGWIYHRREWTLRMGYVGAWVELMFASDEHMRDTGMVSYYRRKLDAGTYDGPWSRAALHPGWHLTFRPRLTDRLLGRQECVTTKGDPEPVLIPMPEGNYPGTMRREERVWKRKRWPWTAKRRADYWVEMDIAIPVPGKGENSWDCGDDGLYGTGGSTPAEAIANCVRVALRDRERYAGPNWTPTADGWPEGIGSRAA
jgi:hypothetical protein